MQTNKTNYWFQLRILITFMNGQNPHTKKKRIKNPTTAKSILTAAKQNDTTRFIKPSDLKYSNYAYM